MLEVKTAVIKMALEEPGLLPRSGEMLTYIALWDMWYGRLAPPCFRLWSFSGAVRRMMGERAGSILAFAHP